MQLKEYRLRRGWSQKEVAERLFCSPVVYSRYETGVRQPSLEILIKLADLYGISLDELTGRQPPAIRILDEQEALLLTAARGADERAREDALDLLKAHKR
ncbi:MAG: helix-turn-helix transcriptional regulator [Clostridia bacterium]|nr:helix-turn-helix transcriptional regulator [Clostridia bacterium]